MRLAKLRAVVLICAISTGFAGVVSADVLKLQANCSGEDPCTCSTDLAAILEEIHVPNTLGATCGRQLPGPTNPVLVDIGPGTFSLADTTYPYCDGLSHISFKGAGKIATTLTGGGFYTTLSANYNQFFAPFAVAIESCSNVEFQDLTIQQTGTVKSGVLFEGDGGSQWTNVRILVNDVFGTGWGDNGNTSTTSSLHYWFNDEIEVRQTGAAAGSGIYTESASHRIYGSKFVYTGTGTGGSPYGAMWLFGSFDVRVHGSRIAAFTQALTSPTQSIFLGGVSAPCPNGTLTVEGSEIESVSPANATASAGGIFNACHAASAMNIQVQGSYYNVSGGPTPRRINDRINSPYSLGSGPTPRTVSTNWSVKGMDTFVETDCSATLCNNSNQGVTSHLLTFDPGCTNTDSDHGPWFDTKSGKCRGTP